jgi:ABC-type nitrate/sulfonate/bicarbonate transport system substrate-binding protein
MTIAQETNEPELIDDDSRLWITRCAVPTAVGVAVHHGWFEDEFAADGLHVDYLPYLTSPEAQRRHYDHELTTLLREGGNIPALWTRGNGEPTRLIGLTWIDERQVIIGRPDSTIASPIDLKGKRLGIPSRGWSESVDVFRGMALRGFSGALSAAGLGLEDAVLVDIQSVSSGGLAAQWDPDFDALERGEVDAVYAKGSVAVDAVARYGARVVIELDRDVEPEFRINNGTPRPITAHQGLLDARPEVVERFLAVILRAAKWGSEHPEEIIRVLAEETGADLTGTAGAYSATDLAGFEPTLSADRVAFLGRQKDFLLSQGLLTGDFSVEEWVDEKPLIGAKARIEGSE